MHRRPVGLLLAICALLQLLHADVALPTPTFDASTVLVLQWRQAMNHTLISPTLSSFLSDPASSAFIATSGIDGTGLFLVSGSASSRRRAMDGLPSWQRSANLPAGSVCGSPYLPQGNANHLWILCSPNIIIKRWYDTGVEQFAVQVFLNFTLPLSEPAPVAAPLLTQIVGLSSAYDPPALILGSTAGGSLYFVDSRSGDFLARFAPDGSQLSPPLFTNFVSMQAWILDPIQSEKLVVIAHANNGGQLDQLISFNFDVSTFEIEAKYTILITDAATDASFSVSLVLQSSRMYVRTMTSFTLFTVSTNQALSVTDSSQFPLGSQVRETASGRYAISDKLAVRISSTPDQQPPIVVLSGIDTTAAVPTVAPLMTLSSALESDDGPWHLLLDSSDNLLLISSSRFSSVRFAASGDVEASLSWSFVYFEDWSTLNPDGSSAGTARILSFTAYPELQRITSVSFLPDMTTGSNFVLIRTNATKDGSYESLLAFTTQSAPSCNDTAVGDCVTCEAISGQVTARQCSYCSASMSCQEYIAPGVAAVGSTCADVSFAAPGVFDCTFPPDDDVPSSPWLLVVLIISIVILLLAALAWLIRKSRATTKSRQPRASLSSHYQSLSPDGSFSRMRPASPRAAHSPVPQQLEERASLRNPNTSPLEDAKDSAEEEL